jgi:cell wall-associated NlpC family hydrolase
MKGAWLFCLLAAACPAQTGLWEGIRAAIERNLGRPYVWGAAGMKSFDCSGFVWRVMSENGILLKRTTARKLYLCLPPAGDRWKFGNLVFFDDLKHVGIVNGHADFYHAQTGRGTTRSPFDPYWRRKVYGFRTLPARGDESLARE